MPTDQPWIRRRGLAVAAIDCLALALAAMTVAGCSGIAGQGSPSASVTSPAARSGAQPAGSSTAAGKGPTQTGGTTGATVTLTGAVNDSFTTRSVTCVASPQLFVLEATTPDLAKQVTFTTPAGDRQSVRTVTVKTGADIGGAGPSHVGAGLFSLQGPQDVARSGAQITQLAGGSHPAFRLTGDAYLSDPNGGTDTIHVEMTATCGAIAGEPGGSGVQTAGG